MILALTTSCRPAPPAAPSLAASEVELRMTALEGRLALLEQLLAGREAPAGGPVSTTPLAADDAARVTRVEQRLAKITGFLKQAVRPELDTSQLYALPLDPLDPATGPLDAPVTLVEVFEFLCPYCSVVEPTLVRLQGEYPKTLRVVSKYMVIHGSPAVPSGVAACAAGRQGKYGPFKAALWGAIWPSADANVDRAEAEPAALERQARTVGLDLKRFRADIADDAVAEGRERFGLNLSNAIGATVVDGLGLAEIGANDATAVSQPRLSVADTLVVGESDGYIDIVVSLSAPASSLVTVNYATANGLAYACATADYDYLPVSGTLNFAVGETTKVVRIELSEYQGVEPLEFFRFNLSSPTNAARLMDAINDHRAGRNMQVRELPPDAD